MTQEDRTLLLIDLCARLPHKTYIEIVDEGGNIYDEVELCLQDINRVRYDESTSIRPYLRPMSSMTEEELKEMNEKYGNIAYFFIQEPPYYHGLQAQHSDIGSIEISEFSEIYDWLNAHRFDYRGLIEKDLALEAKPEMYKM